MDDDFGDDADLAQALNAAERRATGAVRAPARPNPVAPATVSKVQQPTPQALPTRQGPTSILVSPRQKGNPILNAIQSVPWEYSDTPADYVLGATTCALFLSLKYHRLHPEYIYSRIRALAGKYNLRVLLTMVDIENHEDPLKELSKTSLVNDLMLILCWSAAEAGRYLSLFKTYEHASPNSIRAHQATGYNERLVEFITGPRSINKTDAISLVSNFGSLRAAINAQPEEISLVGGWGEKKVEQWHTTVNEGFRVKKAKKRGVGINRENTGREMSRENTRAEDNMGDGEPASRAQARVDTSKSLTPAPPAGGARQAESPSASGRTADADKRPARRLAEVHTAQELEEDDMDALIAAAEAETAQATDPLGEHPERERLQADTQIKAGTKEVEMSEGVMAALAKLRERS